MSADLSASSVAMTRRLRPIANSAYCNPGGCHARPCLFAFMLGGKALQTLPVAIPKLITTQGVRWGELAVIGTVALLPVLGGRGLPATPHRSRTDARGGEGIAQG